MAPPPARYPIASGGMRRLLALDEAPARAAWNAHFQQQLDTALDRLRRSGVRAHSVSTAQDPLAALRDLLHGRAPRRDAA
jgi:hypothetical protein